MNKYSKKFFSEQGKIGAEIGKKRKAEFSPEARSEWAKKAWTSRRANLTKSK